MNKDKVLFKEDLLEEIENLRSELEYEYGGEVFTNIYEMEIDFDHNGFNYYVETSDDPRVVRLRELHALVEECNEYNDNWRMIFRIDYSPEDDTNNYVEVSFRDTAYQLILD
jgi:hypothetical protein